MTPARPKKTPKKSVDAMRAWLEKQEAYTLQRPMRKNFAGNPYAVTNMMDVWEFDLLDVQSYAKYNDNYRYILSVIDLFSEFLHMIPKNTNSGHSVASGCRSIFDYPKYFDKSAPRNMGTNR